MSLYVLCWIFFIKGHFSYPKSRNYLINYISGCISSIPATWAERYLKVWTEFLNQISIHKTCHLAQDNQARATSGQVSPSSAQKHAGFDESWTCKFSKVQDNNSMLHCEDQTSATYPSLLASPSLKTPQSSSHCVLWTRLATHSLQSTEKNEQATKTKSKRVCQELGRFEDQGVTLILIQNPTQIHG